MGYDTRKMAHMKRIVALAFVGVAAVEAFSPAMGGQFAASRRVARSSLRMQALEDKVVVPEDADIAARRESTKTILRVPWTTETASKEVVEEMPAAPAPAAAAPAPAAAAPISAKASAKKTAPARVKTEPNQFVTMALKAGALKQSSPLVMSQMAGNKGFDPLGFAKDSGLLLQYREAELKHARLAMLASVGWVMSELLHTPLAELLGKDNLLQEDAGEYLAKAPSVLNGGLQNVPFFFWIATLLLTGAIEGWRMLSINEQGPLKFTPGQLGFDPLGFYAQEGAKGRMDLQTKELNNGRLAMLAIAFFAASEFATNAAVVDQTPGLFTEGPLANAGNLGGLLGEYSGLLSCKSGLVYCTEGQDSFTAMMSNEASNAEYINEIMGE